MLIWVLDDTQVLEQRDCKTITLLNGEIAAIWRGAAYPILPDGASINVTSMATSPEGCVPQSNRSMQVQISETVEAVYLLGLGSAVAREELAASLTRNGFVIERAGHYTGPVGEGIEYDWFIRVANRPDLNKQLLEQLVGAQPTVVSANELRIALLENQLANALSAAASERANAARLKLELASLGDNAAQIERLEAELRALASEAARLTTEAAERTQSIPHRVAPRKEVSAELEDVLQILLPRARLLRDSLSVATIEFSDRKSFYRSLQELHIDLGIPSAWKPVRGASGWIERHVSTGAGDSGRVYARLNKTDRKWDILLSDKSSQNRDIDWLQRI